MKKLLATLGLIGLLLPSIAFAAIPAPVSFWKFDESSGNASDAVGSVTLTNNGTVTYSAGKINNAANISSTGSKYFTATNPSSLNITGSMTIDCWVNFSSFTTNNIMISKWTNAGNERQYELNLSNPGTSVTFDASPDGVNDDLATVSWSPSLSTYYNLGVVFDGSAKTTVFYVNASQQGATQSMSSGTIFNGTSDFGVGGRPGATQVVNGQMDACGIWNSALSAANITSLYNGGTGQQYPFSNPSLLMSSEF